MLGSSARIPPNASGAWWAAIPSPVGGHPVSAPTAPRCASTCATAAGYEYHGSGGAARELTPGDLRYTTTIGGAVCPTWCSTPTATCRAGTPNAVIQGLRVDLTAHQRRHRQRHRAGGGLPHRLQQRDERLAQSRPEISARDDIHAPNRGRCGECRHLLGNLLLIAAESGGDAASDQRQRVIDNNPFQTTDARTQQAGQPGGIRFAPARELARGEGRPGGAGLPARQGHQLPAVLAAAAPPENRQRSRRPTTAFPACTVVDR